MKNLIKAEFRKVFSTQVWFWLLLLALGLSALGTIGSILGPHDNTELQRQVRDVFTAVTQTPSYVVIFALGVLSVTTEYRYQTITPTVLATPSRWTLITAKLISTALLGLAYALACVILEMAIALPWLSSRHISIDFGSHVGALLLVVLVLVLYALVGLGVGALIKNQIIAIAVGVAFVLIIDNVVAVIPGVKHAYQFLLSGATDAITTTPGSDNRITDVHLLSVGGGVVVMLVWASVTAVLGAGISMNRDIT
jgi:ABC-type transport system involved in multi-copper enzyme maturation permease subunit